MKKYVLIPLTCLLILVVYAAYLEKDERIVPSPAVGSFVDDGKVTRATMLLREYDACASREENFAYLAVAEKDEAKARSFIAAAERSHLEMFATLQEFACAYDVLTESERKAFFSIGGNDFPRGYVAAAFDTSEDTRKDLEAFLENAFREIDYMSAFTTPAETHENIKEEHRTTLRARGLIACE